MKIALRCLMILPLLAALAATASAFPCRVVLIPNNPTEPAGETCRFCHVVPSGGGARTAFGQDVAPLINVCEEFWGPAIAALDSDGDGFTNGEELLDPEGLWSAGDPNPGNPALVGDPGDPLITPGTTAPTPTAEPTATPTEAPTLTPTMTPTATPTEAPTDTPAPSPTPTNTPAIVPTMTPTTTPTNTPATTPTPSPTPETNPVLQGDLNKDGETNHIDIFIMATLWLAEPMDPQAN